MPVQWKVKDAEFHMRRADAERRAALRARSEAAASAHRQLALEHQAAVFIATRVRDVPAFDEAEFLNFALRVAVPAEPQEYPQRLGDLPGG